MRRVAGTEANFEFDKILIFHYIASEETSGRFYSILGGAIATEVQCGEPQMFSSVMRKRVWIEGFMICGT